MRTSRDARLPGPEYVRGPQETVVNFQHRILAPLHTAVPELSLSMGRSFSLILVLAQWRVETNLETQCQGNSEAEWLVQREDGDRAYISELVQCECST